jgi:hypothetical protein
MWLWIVN